MKKPKFQSSGIFSEKSMMSMSIEELKRMKKEEKDSKGSFYWYFWPSNIRSLIDYCINNKT